MGLNLITGPANAGKVALLLRRYLEALPREPYLIVPNRSDVEERERELLAIQPALLGGSIGTFDDLFRRLARGGSDSRPVASDAQRALIVRRALAGQSLNGLGRSARFGGFADSLLATVGELESGLLDPNDLEGELAALYAAYRGELDRLGMWDRDLLRRHAAERVAGELEAWGGEPVFAYGFEDLTGAEWALLQALAGRSEVTVSMPYEPGRAAFASLSRTMDDLSGLADGRIEELPPAFAEFAEPALAHLERTLFAESESVSEAPELEGAIRFFESAGKRGALELVGEELLSLLRSGVAAEQIGIVCPSLERWQAPLETALGTLGVPYALEGQARFDKTPYGQALLSLLRFAWLGGGRGDLYTFLRSPYSSLTRQNVDFLEGRLRGRAVDSPERVEEETIRLRDGQPLAMLEAVRSAPSPLDAVAGLAAFMLRAAYGLEAPPVGELSRQDVRAHEAVMRLVAELRGWSELEGSLSTEEVFAAVERAEVRRSSTGEAERIAVLDLLRARTRRFEVLFLLGLEEGSLPRRGHESPFLGDDARRDLDERSRARLTRPDHVARDRYLFYTACTRANKRLYLVREAATDEGSPREPSPFWDEVQAVFPKDDVARWTRRRPLSALTWPLEEAPTERERLRAVAIRAADDSIAADAIATANGWDRRLARALRAFERPTRLTHPQVLAELAAKGTFGVTELERFADCSSIWFLERLIDPKSIDARVDMRMRGSVAHQALYKFYSGLPKELGADRVEPDRVEDALAFLRRCLDDAVQGVRVELTDLQRRELRHGLWRDLEAFVREEAVADMPLVPRRFEVLFGSERSAPELQRGLALAEGITLSGKIDRIDVDPFSARGIVQDYKAGKYAHSAQQIESEKRLQIPLYMLVLRDLVGVEPLGGLYRPLSGERKARGLLRAEAREDGIPGFAKNDYLAEEEFWGKVEGARELAVGIVERIRTGDVQHDPKGGDCPTWCELSSMCRIKRA
ncbi:MAG TPA: PD-(D/E)XK nuclease family protein [Gaiellaceae bacterium]